MRSIFSMDFFGMFNATCISLGRERTRYQPSHSGVVSFLLWSSHSSGNTNQSTAEGLTVGVFPGEWDVAFKRFQDSGKKTLIVVCVCINRNVELPQGCLVYHPWNGEGLGNLEGSRSRAHQENSVEVVWAPYKDTPWSAPIRAVLVTLYWMATTGKT